MTYSVVVEHRGASPGAYGIGAQTSVGRSRDCDVSVASAFLLPRHFVLRGRAGHVEVEPLTAHSHRAPTLGVYVNREQVLGVTALTVGDRLSPVAYPTDEHPVFVIGDSPVPVGGADNGASDGDTASWKFWKPRRHRDR